MILRIFDRRIEQNIGIVACSVPALQPLFKRYFEKLATRNTSKGAGAKNNAGITSWKDSTAKAFSSRSRTSRNFHSIQNDASSDSEERILGDKGKDGITKTTDVELFYTEAGKPVSRTNADTSIEMV